MSYALHRTGDSIFLLVNSNPKGKFYDMWEPSSYYYKTNNLDTTVYTREEFFCIYDDTDIGKPPIAVFKNLKEFKAWLLETYFMEML